MKKTLSILLSLVIVMLFAVSALAAANLTEAQAKEKALQTANVTADSVNYIYAELDYENGVAEWEVEFSVGDRSNGLEYEYTLDAATGNIKEVAIEVNGGARAENNGEMLDKQAAFDYAKLAVGAEDAKLLRCELDREGSKASYEMKFSVGDDVRYECEVDAYTGAVREVEVEFYNTSVDRITLLIEKLIAFFRSFFK